MPSSASSNEVECGWRFKVANDLESSSIGYLAFSLVQSNSYSIVSPWGPTAPDEVDGRLLPLIDALEDCLVMMRRLGGTGPRPTGGTSVLADDAIERLEELEDPCSW